MIGVGVPKPPAAGDSGHAVFERLKPGSALSAGADADRANAPGGVSADAPPKQTRQGAAFARSPAANDRQPAPDWLPDAQLERAAPSAIALLTRLWGTAAGARALRALVLDGEGMARRWPSAVWPELELLCAVHAMAYAAPADAGATAVPDIARLPLIETGYRRVLERLVKSWGHVEAFAVVCRDLLFDHRGDRTGWPAEVWEDLVLLQRIHDSVYGRLPPGAEPWKAFFLAR